MLTKHTWGTNTRLVLICVIGLWYIQLINSNCILLHKYKLTNPLRVTWWRHQMETFSALLYFFRGISRSPVNSPYKGQWRGALMFSLICVWINDWVNNRKAGDLRRYRAHYDVSVMIYHVYQFQFLGNIANLEIRTPFTHSFNQELIGKVNALAMENFLLFLLLVIFIWIYIDIGIV